MTVAWFPRRTLAALIIVLFHVPASDGRDPKADARIALLITQLGSDDYQEREDATRGLQELGAPALPALRDAVRSSDPEVNRRAALLVRRLEVHLESERLLTPEKVRLTAENTPLMEVIADLNKKTGLQVVLEGNAEKLGRKKITLDTGDVPVWEAVHQLYRRAGLTDKVQIDTKGHEDRTVITSLRMNGNRVYVNHEIAELDEIKLMLSEGEVEKVPTAVTGAVRLRVLGAAETTPDKTTSGQIGFNLLLTTEPRIQWLKRGAVRIELARDDQDQVLQQAFDIESNKTPEARSNIYIGGSPLVLDAGGSTAEHVIAVRLRSGKKSTKTIKELRGTITGQIQTAPEPLITVDSVLQA
jgi:hypothetical protein